MINFEEIFLFNCENVLVDSPFSLFVCLLRLARHIRCANRSKQYSTSHSAECNCWQFFKVYTGFNPWSWVPPQSPADNEQTDGNKSLLTKTHRKPQNPVLTVSVVLEGLDCLSLSESWKEKGQKQVWTMELTISTRNEYGLSRSPLSKPFQA